MMVTQEPASVFALCSCQYPPDLFHTHTAYNALWQLHDELSLTSYRHLQRILLLAGDGIYSDPTAGFFDPVDPREKFEAAYRAMLSSPAWRALNTRLNYTCFAIDDHEIHNNWEPSLQQTDAAANLKELHQGKQAFLQYRQQAGKLDEANVAIARLWGARTLNGTPLFIMDTRTQRSARVMGKVRDANLVDKQQLTALLQWLDRQKNYDDNSNRPPIAKLVLSGSVLLPRRKATAQATTQSKNNAADTTANAALHSDAWDGYPATQEAVLAHIALNEIENVMFLSGDEHLSCIARATVQADGRKPIAMVSIHGSPLYAPLPFANARPENFQAIDNFSYPHSDTRIAVSSETTFTGTGDGFALLVIGQRQSAYEQRVEFIGGDKRVSFDLKFRSSHV